MGKLLENPDIAALEMVDDAYLDKDEWCKKSIRTTAKASPNLVSYANHHS